MQNSFTMESLNRPLDFKNVDDAYLQALQDDFSLDEESCDEDSDPSIMHSMKPEIMPTEKLFTNHNSLSTQENAKKVPPPKGKKTKGRVKIKMEFIDNKLRRYTTFSKRKTGIMKKAYELSTLTGTQVMLLVASETGHVYTFATRKLQPMITSEAGKALIQTCLNTPDLPHEGGTSSSESVGGGASPDQRMSATGFEETELSYSVGTENEMDFKAETQSSPSNGGHFIAVPSPSSSPNDTPATSKAEASSQSNFATLIAQDGNISQAIPFGSLQALASVGHKISSQGASPMYRISIPTSMATAVATSPTSSGCKTSRSSSNTTTVQAPSIAAQTVTVAATPQLIPANVVLPNGSTGIVYQTPQGVMYAPARADNASGGLILKLQDQTALSPFITIPYPIATSSSPSTPTTTQESKGPPLPKMPKLSRPSKK